MTRLAKITIICLLVTGIINLCIEIYLISINFDYAKYSTVTVSIFYSAFLLLSISPSVALIRIVHLLQKHNKPFRLVSIGASIISILVTIGMVRTIFVAEAQPFHDVIYILELVVIFLLYLFWP